MKRVLVMMVAVVPLVAGCSVFRSNPVPPNPALVGVQAQNAAWAGEIKRGRDGEPIFGPLVEARTAVDEARSQAQVDEYDADSLQKAESVLADAESGWQAIADEDDRDPEALAEVANNAHQAQRLAEIARYTAMREINLDRLNAVTEELDSRQPARPQDNLSGEGDLLGQRVIPGRLGSVAFQTGTPRLTAQSRQVVGQLAALLRRNPNYGIAILGHTDNTAPADQRLQAFAQANPSLEDNAPTHADKVAAFNLALSSARARAVARQLVDNGIPAARIGARGFGDQKPVASNDTAEGRRANRRVEAIVVPGPDSPAREKNQGGG